MESQFAALIGPDGKPKVGAPLGALLTAHAEATPDAAALSVSGTTLTFAELDASANCRARALERDCGVGAGDRVAIGSPNSAQWIEAAFAVWKLGATVCPVSWRMAGPEFAEVLELLDPVCVIGTSALMVHGFPRHDLDRELVDELDAAPLPALSTRPGKILNSGGSTGRPKLIVDPEASTWGPDKEARRMTPRLTFLNPGPLYHSAPFNYTCMAVAQGCHAICLEKFDVDGWINAVEFYRPDFCYLVPTMMGRIAKAERAQHGNSDLSPISNVSHMSAPCPADVKRWWIDRVGAETVLEIYGGTERIGAATIDGREWLEHPGSVGRIAAGYDCFVLDDEGKLLPPGEVGQLWFRNHAGVGAAYEYVGADQHFRGDLDSFGDMGWLDADGYLYIADRRTDMVTVGGANVFPAEIEAQIEAIEGVHCAVVIGLPDADMGNRLHAIVELAPDVPVPSDGMAFLAPATRRLGGLKRPRSVEFTLDRLRDDAGKVRRSRLREDRLDRDKDTYD